MVVSSIAARFPYPALLTNTSRRPNTSTANWTAAIDASRSPGGLPSAEETGDCVGVGAGIGQAGRREHGDSVSLVEEQGGGHARRISGAGEAGAGATA